MKGPYERLKYDLARIWECPHCHRRERTTGATTSMSCACQPAELSGLVVSMKLIAEGPRRAAPLMPAPVSPLPTSEPQ